MNTSFILCQSAKFKFGQPLLNNKTNKSFKMFLPKILIMDVGAPGIQSPITLTSYQIKHCRL